MSGKSITTKSQPALFDAGPDKHSKAADGWKIVRTGCGGKWLHVESDWFVKHCGRPSAPWPYTAGAPDVKRSIVGPSGRGFRTLAQAKAAVQFLLDNRHARESYLNEPEADAYRVPMHAIEKLL